MAQGELFEACGFTFSSQEEADAAIEEEKKVQYIKSRLNKSDDRSILVIYNKMVKGNVMKTPVGQMFLKEIYDTLVKSPDIEEKELEHIQA